MSGEYRGHRIGTFIVQHLERAASERQIAELVLLTETAKDFFAARGYRVIGRDVAPPSLQQSEEFRSLCPQSATCMAKTL